MGQSHNMARQGGCGSSGMYLLHHNSSSRHHSQSLSLSLSAKGCWVVVVVAQNADNLRLDAQPPNHPAKNEHRANFMHKYLHEKGVLLSKPNCSSFGYHFWWNHVDPPCRRYVCIFPLKYSAAFSAAASSCSHGLTKTVVVAQQRPDVHFYSKLQMIKSLAQVYLSRLRFKNSVLFFKSITAESCAAIYTKHIECIQVQA